MVQGAGCDQGCGTRGVALKSSAQLDREIAEILARKHSQERAEDVTDAAYAVFDRPGGEDLTRAEFREEVLGLLRHGGSGVDRAIDSLYKHIYGGKE